LEQDRAVPTELGGACGAGRQVLLDRPGRTEGTLGEFRDEGPDVHTIQPRGHLAHLTPCLPYLRRGWTAGAAGPDAGGPSPRPRTFRAPPRSPGRTGRTRP